MTLRILVFIAALAAAECGQLSVLYTSPSVQFKSTNDILPESHVTSVLQSALGLQPDNDLDWRGLFAGSFFDRPSALLLLTVSGVRLDQLNMTNIHSYDTLEDDPAPLSLHTVVDGLEELSREERPVLFIEVYVDKRHVVHLEHSGLLGRVHNLQLPVSTPRYLVEFHAIRQTINKVADNFATLHSGGTPDVYHFHISGFEHVVDRHGAHSAQMSTAVTSLHDTVTQAVSTLRKLYEDDLTVLLLCQATSRQQQSYPSTSVARRRLQETTPNTELITDLNLAPEFTWMYPAMFNISLWFMVTFVITIFGVSWCMWFTDPGRDGVIYRMTTHHIKEA